MRFITEFEYDGARFDITPEYIKYRKEIGQAKLGDMLAESFGWQEMGETALHLDEPVKERHTIEIEAFPMDKWIEFKQKLFDQLREGIIPPPARNEIKIYKLIKELESFGKPSGV